MRTILLSALLSCLMSLGCIADSEAISTEFEKIRADVYAIQDKAGVKDTIKVILAPKQMFGISPIAWTRVYSITQNEIVYGVYIRESFIEEASPLLIEHIAWHEICHLVNNDLSKMLTSDMEYAIESGVEKCIFDLVGDVHYQEFIDALQAWSPKDQILEVARRKILHTMYKR